MTIGIENRKPGPMGTHPARSPEIGLKRKERAALRLLIIDLKAQLGRAETTAIRVHIDVWIGDDRGGTITLQPQFRTDQEGKYPWHGPNESQAPLTGTQTLSIKRGSPHQVIHLAQYIAVTAQAAAVKEHQDRIARHSVYNTEPSQS